MSAAWELELLISGAVTFALLQLPDVVEHLRALLLPGFGGTRTGLLIATMGAVYAKAALYTLIVTFLVNLAARAYWVGLVGLHSVYPEGPRWDRLRMGPVFTEQYRRGVPALPTVIARVDNFASVIFSFGFLIVVWVIASVILVGAFAGIAWGISRVALGGRWVFPLTIALGALFVAPGIVGSVIDRQRAGRLTPEARRRLERWARFAARASGAGFYGPILFTLTSNLRRGRLMGLAYLTLFGALAVSMAERFVRDGLAGPRAAAFVPADPDVRGVHADHYESLVTPAPGDRNVTIQSDVVEGPYLRLFIPFREERHAAALRACPPRPRAGADSSRAARDAEADRVLGCLTALHDVRVDGLSVAAPGFRFYRHPASGVQGIVAYLPTTGWSAGPHVVAVRQVPPLEPPGTRRRVDPAIVEIPFWR